MRTLMSVDNLCWMRFWICWCFCSLSCRIGLKATNVSGYTIIWYLCNEFLVRAIRTKKTVFCVIEFKWWWWWNRTELIDLNKCWFVFLIGIWPIEFCFIWYVCVHNIVINNSMTTNCSGWWPHAIFSGLNI